MKISFVACVLALAVLAGCNVKLTPKRPTPDRPPPASSEQANELVELNRRVQELQRGGQYAEAIPLAQRAVELYEKDLGPAHPYVITALATLAKLYRANGEHARAEPLFARVLAGREAALGPGHPDVAAALSDLALLHDAVGDYAKSKPLHQRALAIRDASQGSEHPDVATALNNLALLYDATGDAARAEPLYQRALAIREKALGREHPLVADIVNNLAVLLRASGSPAKAEPLHQQALAIREKAFGPGHPDVAASLNNLADLYFAGGSAATAEPLYRRALAIREKALGAGHPDVATTLNNLAELYRASGNASQSEPLYLRALAIREKTLGPEHLKTALTLAGLGALHDAGGDYAKAEALYRRALAIREKVKGGDHPDVAGTLGALALLYKKVGDYEQAEALYRRVLRIQEKALGPTHRHLVAHLGNLAVVHEAAGHVEQAEPLYQRVLDIHEKLFGPEHPTVAADLSTLGALHAVRGNAGKAESFYRRALDIREKVLGTGHPSVATELNNLAALYRETGTRAQAEALLRQALEIDELALGPHHPNVATDLSNLAALFRDAGSHAKAKPLLERALAIDEGALGPTHLSTASSLANLAGLYQAMGDGASAAPLFRRALAVQEQALGGDHPEMAGVLGSLVAVYVATGEFAKAEPLAQRLVSLREKAVGPDHPAVAQSLITSAWLAASQQHYREASDLFKRGLALQDRQIRHGVPVAEEAQRPALHRSLSGDLFMYLSLLHQYGTENGDAAREGLERVMRRKGAVIDAEFLAGDGIRNRLSAQTLGEWRALEAARGDLDRMARAKPEKMARDAYREALAGLQQRIEAMEQRLAGDSAAMARALQRRAITAEGAAKALPEHSALVEFMKFREFDFGAGTWKSTGRYLAFVLRKSGDAAIVDLGDAAKLEERIRRALEDVRRAPHAPTKTGEAVSPKKLAGKKPAVKKLRGKKPRGRPSLQPELRPLEDLYAHLWAPLETVWGGADKILLSPDGMLNLVPFAALQDGRGRAVVERYQLVYLAGGGELAGGERGASRPGSDLLLVANPAFGARAAGFAPLPGAERDGREMAGLIVSDGAAAQVLVGALATERAVKAAHSPRILHLATRCFFHSADMSDQDVTAPAGSSKKGRSVKNGGAATSHEMLLTRSGLAMAGANEAEEATDGDDGLLTAMEIAGLDLAGTEMVALPACETGAGQAQNGGGVFGLRRAFAFAGAKHLLLSLWPVRDEVAERQLKAFYNKARTMPPADALWQAQLESILELKAQYGAAPPGLWAPFILQAARAFGP